MTKPLSEYTREELIELVKCQKNTIQQTKKFGLVWEDKPEKVATDCEKKLPVIKEVPDKAIDMAGDGEPTNIIIEGDNYHALSALNYTHAGKIDVIYIDPPYNTGNKDWRYNNDYVDIEDPFRHTKWISMMAKRLELAKNLLSEKGIIICAIDHYELFYLGALMDQVFDEENRLGVVAVVHKSEGRNQEKFFGTSHEYALFYANDKKKASFQKVALADDVLESFNRKDDNGLYRLNNYLRSGGGDHNLRINKPHFFYPIFVSTDGTDISLNEKDGYEKILPITEKGQERTWKTKSDTFLQRLSQGLIVAERDKNGKMQVYEKYYENQVIKTHWVDPKYHAIHYGTKIVDSIIGKEQFNFPKSLYLIKDIVKLTASKDSTILDFFAGSGTTGHAVMELNKEDGGHRQFILCTNNENKIAEEVTYPRIKGVIDGYGIGDKHVDGIPANIRYFKTDFVDKNDTMDKLRRELCPACEDMIRVREGAFEKVVDEDMLKVYRNSRGLTAIIYDRFELAQYIEEIERIETDTPIHLYVFSYSKSNRFDEMPANFKHKYESQPIPDGVLEIYKKIFANAKGGNKQCSI